MSTFPNPYSRPQTLEYGTSAGVVARFMNNVYAWMAAGLALTAVGGTRGGGTRLPSG